MAAGWGDLNGSGPQQAYVWLNYVSYDAGTNRSTWYYEAVYKGNGGGGWHADANASWSLSGFASVSARMFAVPQGGGDILLGSGYFTKTHDANGYLAPGTLTLWINDPSPFIGAGSAAVGSGTPPRIPKPPGAPPAAVINSVNPDGVVFTIAAPADNGGATIRHYDLQILKEVSGPNDVLQQWKSPSSRQVRGSLQSGATHRIRYRAVTDVSYGFWSPYATFTTPSGIFVSDGVKWVPVSPKVSDGTKWVAVVPEVSDGAVWKEPLDV